jgi:2-methylisocitrate lyase-like PEP mutase family enzyme
MDDNSANSRARLLRSLHSPGRPLLLPNAWDVASAVVIAAAGARAIATTSGGVAWACGYADGECISRDELVRVVARIVAAVPVPVNADIEAGYGDRPEDVATTVKAVAAAGAAGVNVEDALPGSDGLVEPDVQAGRLAAARAAAADSGVPDLVLNARTDVFLRGVGDPAGRLDDTVDRAGRYAEAGADCLFVPGLLDLGTLALLVAAAPLPVAVMAGPGAPAVSELAAIGVSRISLGTSVAQAAYGLARRAARELLNSGTFSALDGGLDYAELNASFGPR